MAELFVLEGSASSWEEALRLTSKRLFAEGCVKRDFYKSCVERELQYPTGFSDSCPVAIPHTTADYVMREAICVLRLKQPVEFRSIEDSSTIARVRYVFNLALLNSDAHLELIRHLIVSARDPRFFERLDLLGVSDLQDYLLGVLFDQKGRVTCG